MKTWKSTPEGVVLFVKIIPNASRNEIVGCEGERLKVRLNAVAEKGKANAQLIKFFSKSFKIPKSDISIIQGEKSREKALLFHLSIEVFETLLFNLITF